MRSYAETKGAVAAGHDVTAHAAALALAAGGNAFDAAVAGCFAACVAEPVLASIGGGGFATLMTAEAGQPIVLDFFAQTPRQRRDAEDVAFFEIEANFGETTQAFHIGLGAAATPGFVPGMFSIWQRFGSLPLSVILEPAICAARDGVAITDYQAFLLGVVAPIYCHDPASLAIFGGAAPSGLLSAGQMLRNPDLVDAFAALDDEGPRSVVDGHLAKAMIACSGANGGHLHCDDLTSYRVHEREPLQHIFRGATIWTNPPPSSGGVLTAFALGLIERAGMMTPTLGEFARVFCATNQARASVTGAGGGDLSSLLSPETVDAYARSIGVNPPANRGTTHISVIDGQGNAIAITLSNGEGCGVVVPGCGFMLNNMLGEEDINPAGLGRWQVDRRMSSMMMPTIIEDQRGGLTALGSGGSNRIRTAMTQVIERLSRGRIPLAEAIGAPRCHVEGDNAFVEAHPVISDDIPHDEFASVKSFSERSMFFGGVHAVRYVADHGYDAAGDPRRAGSARVVND